MMSFRDHPLFKLGWAKLRVALHDHTMDAMPPRPDDYTIPKLVLTVGYGLPGEDVYAGIARSMREEPARGGRKVGKHPMLGAGYDKSQPPMVSTYMGVNVEDMSREELISAVIQLGTALHDANASALHYAKGYFGRFSRVT